MIHIPANAVRKDLAKLVTVVDVTPELAEKWLAHNIHNRRPRHAMIARFVDDMRFGSWGFNGASIVFADDGTLLDGQNRLHSVVESGVTVPMVVVTGLPISAQDDIDTGAVRKFADVLTLAGEVNTSTLASLVRFCRLWELGERRSALFGGQLSISAGQRFLEQHSEMREITTWTKYHADMLSPTLTGGLYWVFGRIDDERAPEDAEAFFARLVDGQHLAAGDPVYELRRALDNRGGAGHSTRRTRATAAALTIKAWNAYRDGEPVARLYWRQGGAKPEAFPEPR